MEWEGNFMSPLRLYMTITFAVICETHVMSPYHSVGVAPKRDAMPVVRKPDISEAAIIEGDIVLGGLFPIHTDKNDKHLDEDQCGSLDVERGIHRLEAMLYAIQQVNKNHTLLPNITLGAQARDTCNVDSIALEESIHFIADSLNEHRKPFRCSTSEENESNQSHFIAGVIGAASSAVSIQVAHLLRLFKLPQISYASTSPDLSNKAKYKYFLRTVPSDSNQAKAMVDIVKALNWTSVFTVYSEGNYGQSGINKFLKLARAANICVVDSWMVYSDTGKHTFDEKLRGFMKEKNTRGVVMFCTDNDARKLLESARRVKAVKRFTWLASDYWGTRMKPVKGLEEVAEGAITISPRSVTKCQDFEAYFKNLDPRTHTKNPWFKEYWSSSFNCSFRINSSIPCEPDRFHLKNTQLKIDDKVPFVIDAVFAFVHAIDKIYKAECPKQEGVCKAMTTKRGENLLAALKNVSFQGVTGEVTFDKNGDVLGIYDVFRFINGKYTKRVASWRGGRLKDYANLYDGEIPESFCGKKCKLGFYKLEMKPSCCWECIPCGRNKYVQDGIRCVSCKSGEIPNKFRTGCESLPIRTISKNWKIVVKCLASLGLFLTVVVFITFVIFNNTPLVKASGRELTYTLLSGLTLCYLLSLCLMLVPTTLVCSLQRIGIGFCFSVCFSSLLIKTNRIARIFKKSERSTKPPNFINPASQMFILTVFLTLEVGLVSIGLIKWPPKPVLDFPTNTDVLLICNVQDYDFIVSLSYNVLLIILCTFFAIRTRKTPANFNEARYIGFAMYTTCLIWITFVPVHFGFNKEYATITLAITTILNASTLLLCIFGPKLFILLLRPTRNVRSRSLSRNTWRNVDFVTRSSIRTTINRQAIVGSASNLTLELCCDNLARNGISFSDKDDTL